jgi:hypothetical protein
MRVVLLLIVVLLIWTLVTVRVEPFGLFGRDRTYYYVQDGTNNFMNYVGCVGIRASELNSRLNSSPCYYKMFNDAGRTLSAIDQLARGEMEKLGGEGKTVGVLIATSGGRQQIIMFFPDYDRNGEFVKSFGMISKLHRWYFRLMYTRFYGAHPVCIAAPDSFNNCPGSPGLVVRRSGNFIIGKTWRIYVVPCGMLGGRERNYELGVYTNDSFYAFYTPKWADLPKLYYMSQFDAMRFGCEGQLVSENRMWVCYLSTRGLGVYRVSGDVYGVCRGGGVGAGALKWLVPVRSRSYAVFKLEDNKVKLIDYNRAIWTITMNTKRTPIVLKLNNDGYFEFYDADGNYIDNITDKDINDLLNPDANLDERNRRLRMERDMDALRRNMERDRRAQEEAQAALDEEERRRRQRELDYYNKFMCPIG